MVISQPYSLLRTLWFARIRTHLNYSIVLRHYVEVMHEVWVIGQQKASDILCYCGGLCYIYCWD